MVTFVIVMDSEGAAASSQVKTRLQEKFKHFHEFSPTSFLVADDVLTLDVAEAAGIKGENRQPGATGAIFKIAGYSGYTDRSLWEWLGKVET